MINANNKEGVMSEQEYKLQPAGIPEILKTVFKNYRDNFGLFFGVTLIVLAPVLVLSGFNQLKSPQYLLLLRFLTIFGGSIAAGVISLSICGSYHNEKVSLKELFRRLNQQGLFAVIGGGFLVSIMVVGFDLVRLGLLKIGIYGTVFFIPAAVLFMWVLVNWSLFAQSAAIENVIDSFKRSRELVRHNWWRVFGLLLLLGMIVSIPLLIASTAAKGIEGSLFGGMLFSVITIVFTAPVFMAAAALLYIDLRVRNENLNMERLTQELRQSEGGAEKIVIDEGYMRKRNALFIVLCANLFLIILKFVLSKISGSVAIAASGWMSVENFFLTGAVLFGVIVSARDKRVSKRLSIIENALAIAISIAVLYIAGNMFVKMFIKMAQGMKSGGGGHGMAAGGLMYVPAVTVAAVFGAGICYFMSQYKIYIGKSCKSTSIEAAGRHCRLHVFMEMAVIIGLIGAWIGLEKLNLLAAAFVLAYVIYTGFTILWRGYQGLTAGYPMEHACHIERNYKLIGSFTAVMLVLYLATGIYTVKWNENGVLKQFGREVRVIEPGLYYHLPWPVETVEKVKMDEVRKLETEPILLVAGDENLVKVRIGVHYNVKNASDYLFGTEDPRNLVLYNTETAVRDVIGRMKIIGEAQDMEYLLTTGKAEVEATATKSLQQLLDKDRSGTNVLNVQILSLDPPDEVAMAFRDIASAMEEKQTYILEAEEYSNQIITESRGKALAMVNLAEGYRVKKINNAEGEAARYLKKLTEYQKAREITNIRLYLETMEKILPGVKKVFVDENINKQTTDLWLLNDKVKGNVVGFE
jgi:membrane protease subunit HflK